MQSQRHLSWRADRAESHQRTNGQVERMNRTIKEATGKRFHHDDHDQLRNHLANLISANNSGRE